MSQIDPPSKQEFLAQKEQETLPDAAIVELQGELGITLDEDKQVALRQAYLNLIIDLMPQQKWGKQLRRRQEKLHEEIAATYHKLAELLIKEVGTVPWRPAETALLTKVGMSGFFKDWEVLDEVMRCHQLAAIAQATIPEIEKERSDTIQKKSLNSFIECFWGIARSAGYRHSVKENRDRRVITPFVCATSKLFEQLPLTAQRVCGFRLNVNSEATEAAIAERIHRYGLQVDKNVSGQKAAQQA